MSESIKYPWDTFCRFRLEPHEEAEVLFVDGDNTPEESIPYFKEHLFLSAGGKERGFAACTGEDCILCSSGLKPRHEWLFTVVRLGPEPPFPAISREPELLVAGKESMFRILQELEERDGLAGSVWKLRRSGPKSASIGDVWRFVRRIGRGEKMLSADRWRLAGEETGIDAHILLPVDYDRLMRPRSREELISEGIDVATTLRMQETGWGGRDRDRS